MVGDDQELTVDTGASDDLSGSGASTTDRAHPAGAVMQLLAGGVPLALLADLAAPDGPASQVILETEGLPDDAWWEPETGSDQAADQASDELAIDPEAAGE